MRIRHVLSEVDPAELTAQCSHCGRVRVRRREGVNGVSYRCDYPYDGTRWLHVLSDVDPERRTATCAVCGTVRIQRRGRGYRCAVASDGLKRSARRSPRAPRGERYSKGSTCERCGFEAKHPAQLDVHHRDRDHGNNELANLETVCANCHRLEHAYDRART